MNDSSPPPLRPDDITLVLNRQAGFPRHAPHQNIGYRVERPGDDQDHATTRLRWNGEPREVQQLRLLAVRAFLAWSGRPSRAGQDNRGPFVLVIKHEHATAQDLVIAEPAIEVGRSTYRMVSDGHGLMTGMRGEQVMDLADDTRRRNIAVYQLPDGEIRMGATRLTRETSSTD